MSADAPERPSAVHNEQAKLAATAVNTIGVATVVTGAVVPLVSHIASVSSAATAGGYAGWLVIP